MPKHPPFFAPVFGFYLPLPANTRKPGKRRCGAVWGWQSALQKFVPCVLTNNAVNGQALLLLIGTDGGISLASEITVNL